MPWLLCLGTGGVIKMPKYTHEPCLFLKKHCSDCIKLYTEADINYIFKKLLKRGIKNSDDSITINWDDLEEIKKEVLK